MTTPATNATLLRKVAAKLREEADSRDYRRTVKCAQVLRGLVSLQQLKRKIGASR